MAKPWWLSRTLWFSVVMAAVSLAAEALPLLDQLVALGLSPDIAAQARIILTVVWLIGSAILRAITDKPLALK